MNYRNLVQFVGYEGPMHMNEEQFRAFWNPLSEPFMREGGVSKIILSQVCCKDTNSQGQGAPLFDFFILIFEIKLGILLKLAYKLIKTL